MLRDRKLNLIFDHVLFLTAITTGWMNVPEGKGGKKAQQTTGGIRMH